MSTHPSYEQARDSAGGWSLLEDPERRFRDAMRKMGARRRELGEAVARLAETPDGRALLEHLLDRTVRRQPVPNLLDEPVAITAEQLMPRVLAHAGAVAIVEEILILIRIGSEAPFNEET